MKAPNDGLIRIGEEISLQFAGLGSVDGMNIDTELKVVGKNN